MANPYPNGRAPRAALIHRGGNHWLPPGTNAAWDALVADGKKTLGVTFVITPRGGPDDITNGENGYRFLNTQVTARAKACARGNCAQAAYPGTSNHGIGRAIDVYNWAAVPWSKFVALCKRHGFVTLTVAGERWHIYFTGDPWAAPSGGGAHPIPTPPTPIPEPDPEEDDMSPGGFTYTRASDNVTVRLVVDTRSGFFWEWSDSKILIADVARVFGIPLPFAPVTQGARDGIKAACDRVAP